MIVMEVTQRWFFFFFSYYFNTAATTATITTTTTSPPAVPVPVLFITVVVSTSATIILRLPLLHLQGAPTLFNSFYFPSCILPSVFVSYYLFHTSTLPSRFPVTCLSQFLSFFLYLLPALSFLFFLHYLYSLTSSLSFDSIYFSFSIISSIFFSLSLYFTSLLLP